MLAGLLKQSGGRSEQQPGEDSGQEPFAAYEDLNRRMMQAIGRDDLDPMEKCRQVYSLLLDGADPNFIGDSDINASAIHYAARTGILDLVWLLLCFGADSSVKTKQGETPLQILLKHPCRWHEDWDVLAKQLMPMLGKQLDKYQSGIREASWFKGKGIPEEARRRMGEMRFPLGRLAMHEKVEMEDGTITWQYPVDQDGENVIDLAIATGRMKVFAALAMTVAGQISITIDTSAGYLQDMQLNTLVQNSCLDLLNAYHLVCLYKLTEGAGPFKETDAMFRRVYALHVDWVCDVLFEMERLPMNLPQAQASLSGSWAAQYSAGAAAGLSGSSEAADPGEGEWYDGQASIAQGGSYVAEEDGDADADGDFTFADTHTHAYHQHR